MSFWPMWWFIGWHPPLCPQCDTTRKTFPRIQIFITGNYVASRKADLQMRVKHLLISTVRSLTTALLISSKKNESPNSYLLLINIVKGHFSFAPIMHTRYLAAKTMQKTYQSTKSILVFKIQVYILIHLTNVTCSPVQWKQNRRSWAHLREKFKLN